MNKEESDTSTLSDDFNFYRMISMLPELSIKIW